MELPKCGLCRRRHKRGTRCSDVFGCWCDRPGHAHMRHPRLPRFTICSDPNCPCIYKNPGPIPAKDRGTLLSGELR